MSVEQRDPAGSLTHEAGSHWPRRHYVVAWRDTVGIPVPDVGQVICTIPGAYWTVTAVQELANSYDLEVQPLRPTSLEAHGSVRHLHGGTLH